MSADAATATESEPADDSPSVVPVRASRSSQSIGGGGGRFRQRRQSKNERINEILKNARDRADDMGSDPVIIRQHSTFGRTTQFVSPDAAADAANDDDGNDQDDETTGIVLRGTNYNYQAVSPPPPGSNMRSIYNLRSRSTAAGQSTAADGDDGDDDDEDENCAVAAAGKAQDGKPWWKKELAKYQSIELENKGSVARDHLALERTFLAWLRTSLAFASIGIAVTQLFRLNTSLASDRPGSDGGSNKATLRRLGRPLGAAFLAISILVLLLGFKRYFHGQEWILKGKFPASRGTILLASLVALTIMVASLVVVVVIHPSEGD